MRKTQKKVSKTNTRSVLCSFKSTKTQSVVKLGLTLLGLFAVQATIFVGCKFYGSELTFSRTFLWVYN